MNKNANTIEEIVNKSSFQFRQQSGWWLLISCHYVTAIIIRRRRRRGALNNFVARFINLFLSVLAQTSRDERLIGTPTTHRPFNRKQGLVKIFQNATFPDSFLYIYVFSMQLAVNSKLPVTGFEPRISGIRRYHANNFATTTGHFSTNIILWDYLFSFKWRFGIRYDHLDENKAIFY